MSSMPFDYSVNQFTTTPWSFEQDVAHYTEAGIGVIEVCQDKLDADRSKEQLVAAVAAGLAIQSVQPSVRTMIPSAGQPEPKQLPQRLAVLRSCVELVAPFAPGAVFVTNTGPAPGGDMVEAIAQTVSGHRELAAVAADRGVRIALEPLNPISLNQESAIWTLRQGLDIVDEIDRDNVGICFDTWNLWQDGNVLDSLRAAGDRIFLLQVSDWRTPRSGADRRSVGTGAIPTGQLLHAVYDIGYRGPCVLEILSQGVPDSVYDTDLDELLHTNRAALDKSWQTIESRDGIRASQ
ncbi:sugar phosphate isomerase/epimerase [Nocardia sp. GTS18]|uniref:sugar phosphate isomerase/epimerase family protein n=1 Tax=Nocardia sp. GTS18 TaxID=1778064 RepID=UPI0015EEC340|nr:sugar phosphate isomerase/epimerase family protein [Nocardia sp. GTS18]